MIEVNGVCKTYGARRVVDDVSFSAPDGAITGFVGPNGAGKSTVLRMIAGLTSPDSGAVRIGGQRFVDAPAPASAMGVFLSAEWIPPAASARAVLKYVAESQGITSDAVRDALELVGLSHVATRRVRTFSLGMRQRLGIAAATLARPRVLLLDEPVNGLDPEGISWLRTYLRQVAESGATVLLSSHHMAELSQIADRVVMLDKGRVMQENSLRRVVARAEPEVFAIAPEPDIVRSALASAGYITQGAGDGFVVKAAHPLDVGRIAFETGVGLTHLEAATRTLEEVYFEMARNE
ncbi:ATP-binding cassette domain-containing protein [Microbacterium sp. NPDC057407]|uniref:ATP-binding cassette domain-containing protein n=1 Tax=Microbacterium sp. NPDC057407 TaxID=3346120 RepID=UPI0036733303